MPSKKSFWYRLGFALERARDVPSGGKRKLETLKKRMPKAPERRRSHPADWPSADELVASGVVALVAKTLDAWRPRKKTGAIHFLKAGVAGVGAAIVLELVRPLLRGEAQLPVLDGATVDRLLVGAGQGVLYGAVVEPRIPGPRLAKGALYGSAEYAVDAAGGLAKLLGPHAPLKRIPVVGHLLEDLDPHDRAYLEHVVFGVTLAMLYRSSPSSNGIRYREEEEGV